MDHTALAGLRQVLVNSFDEEEIRTLLFDLGQDFDALPGVGKAGKAREAVAYFDREDRLLELLQAIFKIRPNAFFGAARDDQFRGELIEQIMQGFGIPVDRKTSLQIPILAGDGKAGGTGPLSKDYRDLLLRTLDWVYTRLDRQDLLLTRVRVMAVAGLVCAMLTTMFAFVTLLVVVMQGG